MRNVIGLFESDAIWNWFLENERRFRRYNSPTPECHRGRWHTVEVALIGPEPRDTPRTFVPRHAQDLFERCQEWFSFRAHPTYYSDRLLRPMLSWIPPVLAHFLQVPGDFSRVRLADLREFLDRHVVQFDVVKVHEGLTEHRDFPRVFFRRQLRRILAPGHPLRLVVARNRVAIEEVIDVAEILGLGAIRFWRANAGWQSLAGWVDVREHLSGTTHPIFAANVPGKPKPIMFVFWHGWRCERFADPGELPIQYP